MNDYIKIALILLLAVVLFLLIRSLLPAVKHSLREMPKWLLVVLIAAVVVAIIFLVKSLAKSGGAIGGADGTDAAPIRQEEQDAQYAECIIIRADEIILDGRVSDLEAVKAYVAEHYKAHKKAIIVDDYGLASLCHEVIAICKDIGAEYELWDEKRLDEE